MCVWMILTTPLSRHPINKQLLPSSSCKLPHSAADLNPCLTPDLLASWLQHKLFLFCKILSHSSDFCVHQAASPCSRTELCDKSSYSCKSEFTIFKCVVEQWSEYSHCFQKITKMFLSCRTETLYRLKHNSPFSSLPLATTILLSDSKNLCTLDILYKWNRTIFVFLLLVYFT